MRKWYRVFFSYDQDTPAMHSISGSSVAWTVGKKAAEANVRRILQRRYGATEIREHYRCYEIKPGSYEYRRLQREAAIERNLRHGTTE